MGNHVRQQLRAAVKTRITGLTTTGASVHGRRVYPLQADTELPALHLYTEGDSNEPDGIQAPEIVERTVDLHVEGVAVAVDDSIEDTLDTIGKEVEAALATPVTVGGESVLLTYISSDFDFEDGAVRAGVIDMVFRALIFNAANAPDVLS